MFLDVLYSIYAIPLVVIHLSNTPPPPEKKITLSSARFMMWCANAGKDWKYRYIFREFRNELESQYRKYLFFYEILNL